jgi:hypothetical protein
LTTVDRMLRHPNTSRDDGLAQAATLHFF